MTDKEKIEAYKEIILLNYKSMVEQSFKIKKLEYRIHNQGEYCNRNDIVRNGYIGLQETIEGNTFTMDLNFNKMKVIKFDKYMFPTMVEYDGEILHLQNGYSIVKRRNI